MSVRRIVAAASAIRYPQNDSATIVARWGRRSVRYVRAFFAFWYDFLIGDDWRIAAGVVATLLLAALVAHVLNGTLATAVVVVGVVLTCGIALGRSVWSKGG